MSGVHFIFGARCFLAKVWFALAVFICCLLIFALSEGVYGCFLQ